MVFPALRVITVSSVPVKSTYSPRLETSRVVSITTVPSITSPVKYDVRGSSTVISRAVDSPQEAMAHRTRNLVPQYEHVAMPNRSTFVGGPPQFGQLNATGPCWPAGTIGCWIGGGGGIVRRLEAVDSARMTKMMMKRKGTQTNGANPRGKNAEDPEKEKAIAETARIPTTTARTMPIATVLGVGLRGTGAGNHPAGGGGGWATPPD